MGSRASGPKNFYKCHGRPTLPKLMISALFLVALLSSALASPAQCPTKPVSSVTLAQTGSAFRLRHPTLNHYWGTQNYTDNTWGTTSTQIKLFSSDISTFKASAAGNTYMPANGWFALKNYNGDCVRHAGFVMWEMPCGIGPDYDFVSLRGV